MERLGPKDSDCGTDKTIDVVINNFDDYKYRYIVESNGELVELTADNASKYVGKKVKMRSPMYCTGIHSQHIICNKCAGNFYYKIGKTNIGLLAGVTSGELSNASLQKFHDSTVVTKRLDLDSALI